MQGDVNVFWFRRDLRLFDNHGFFKALKSGLPVLPIFIFDTDILGKLEDVDDARVTFIRDQIGFLKEQIQKMGSDLKVFHGSPYEVWSQILDDFSVRELYFNRDYEPEAIKRDDQIKGLLESKGCEVHSFKDQVIFERDEILKGDGDPYTVYTPYSKQWKLLLDDQGGVPDYPSEELLSALVPLKPSKLILLDTIGFEESSLNFPESSVVDQVLDNYRDQRDYPAANGTSRLSVHLRFGTISIRKLVRQAMATSEKFLNELIWRDFYSMILFQFPHVIKGAFRPIYDRIEWVNNEAHFEKWKTGQTGIPIVDAGMRELNETGYMHNRVRMIVASFLTKNLLIDWRWGEHYFARKLLDFDLTSNNGGWQWVAGCGCDAAPYFRVFNPVLQAQKFDPRFVYIRKWVPEVDSFDYPQPMVDLKKTRQEALEAYSVVKSQNH